MFHFRRQGDGVFQPFLVLVWALSFTLPHPFQRPNVDWKSVVRSLDYDGFAVFDFRGFEILQKAVTLGSDDPKASALESALGQWQNVAGQLSLIKQAILAPTEIFSFGRIGAPPVLTDAPEGARGLLDSTWNNQVLIETLVRTADSDSVSAVRDLFEHAIGQAPELVSVGLAQMNVSFQSVPIVAVFSLIFFPCLQHHSDLGQHSTRRSFAGQLLLF
jgi:hypothetical protein